MFSALLLGGGGAATAAAAAALASAAEGGADDEGSARPRAHELGSVDEVDVEGDVDRIDALVRVELVDERVGGDDAVAGGVPADDLLPRS